MENRRTVFADGIPEDVPQIPPDVRSLLEKGEVLSSAVFEVQVHGPLFRATPPHYPIAPAQTDAVVGTPEEGNPLHVRRIVLNGGLIPADESADYSMTTGATLRDLFVLEEATRVAILASRVFGRTGSLSRLFQRDRFPRHNWRRGGTPYSNYSATPLVNGYLDPHFEFYDARRAGLTAALDFSRAHTTKRIQHIYMATQRAHLETRIKLYEKDADFLSDDARRIMGMIHRYEEATLTALLRPPADSSSSPNMQQ